MANTVAGVTWAKLLPIVVVSYRLLFRCVFCCCLFTDKPNFPPAYAGMDNRMVRGVLVVIILVFVDFWNAHVSLFDARPTVHLQLTHQEQQVLWTVMAMKLLISLSDILLDKLPLLAQQRGKKMYSIIAIQFLSVSALTRFFTCRVEWQTTPLTAWI